MNGKTKKESKYASERIDLRAIEEEAIAAGQEWVKRRIEEKLREQAAAFSPRGRKKPQSRPASEADG